MNLAISSALSGLQANTDAINVIGNDLANLNTTGYKSEEVQFQDLMSESLGVSGTAGQVGMGVGQLVSLADYSQQGSIQTTKGATDAAIQGSGFFVLTDPNTNETLYTRDGSFQVNASGQLTTDSGQLVQGWNEVNGVINTNAPTTSLTLPLGASVPPTPTTTMNLALNLDSSAASGTTVTAPVQVYDSLGVSHDLTVTYTNTGANSWSYAVTIPSADLAAPTTPPTPVASGTLSFDANGNLVSPLATADPQVVSISGLADDANTMTINWNLYNHTGATPVPTITQYDSSSSISSTTQNGYAAGSVSGVTLQSGGAVMATYTNGQQVAIGQLALASIANPSTLSAVGNNNLQIAPTTATPVVGAANTGGRGQIVAGALESSTVDIATEFANLLTFERGYQADSKVITTSDQLEQQTVELIPQA